MDEVRERCAVGWDGEYAVEGRKTSDRFGDWTCDAVGLSWSGKLVCDWEDWRR